VLVVSRGDEALLELTDRRALHFPQTEDGSWAGHHPGDSSEAIGQLEALRDDGAEYLVVPATYSWWLSHYEGLERHLASRYETLLSDDGAGAIYRLQAASS
jgi:hypothetical protein